MNREPRRSETGHTFEGERDETLIARAVDGDAAAFDVLTTRYRDRIFGFCFHLVRDRAEADDLAQEVFVRAYYGLRTFRRECAFFTWLYRIASNVVYTQTRKSARRREVHQAAEAERQRRRPPPSPAELAERAELEEWVGWALARIDPRLGEVLVLRDLEGMDTIEVARTLGVPEGTVKSRLFRAREDLRRLVLARFGTRREAGPVDGL
jgi:RNA polymerase sigma-70 factor (ECF subfamily)